MYTISVDSCFYTCHSVAAADSSREPVHYHNFCATAEVGAEKLNEKGMVADFCLLKKNLDKITARLAEKADVGEIDYFAEKGQTAEVITRYIYEEFKKTLHGKQRLLKVTVTEEPGCRASYSQ